MTHAEGNEKRGTERWTKTMEECSFTSIVQSRIDKRETDRPRWKSGRQLYGQLDTGSKPLVIDGMRVFCGMFGFLSLPTETIIYWFLRCFKDVTGRSINLEEKKPTVQEFTNKK